MSPNPLVNEGSYNLEVILLYGYADNEDSFHEDFRIDTIITPEIFTRYSNQQILDLFRTPNVVTRALLPKFK